MDHDRLATVMRHLALEAGAAILEVYGRADMGVEAKADASPVTEADLAADRIISAGLRAAFPDVPLVTEEQAATHGDLGGRRLPDRRPARRHQGVRPAARRLHGQHRAGRGRRADARRGLRARAEAALLHRRGRARLGGARARRRGRPRRGPPPPGGRRPTTPRCGSWPPRATATPRPTPTSRSYAVADFKSAGSSLKFCLVAGGEADLYPRLGRTMEWDTAAGQAVLLAAGGRVVRFDDHAPLTYGKPGYENPHFIALAPGVTLKA